MTFYYIKTILWKCDLSLVFQQYCNVIAMLHFLTTLQCNKIETLQHSIGAALGILQYSMVSPEQASCRCWCCSKLLCWLKKCFVEVITLWRKSVQDSADMAGAAITGSQSVVEVWGPQQQKGNRKFIPPLPLPPLPLLPLLLPPLLPLLLHLLLLLPLVELQQRPLHHRREILGLLASCPGVRRTT